MENKNIPKTMENVCQKLFDGDFGAMVCYAKAYKEGERRNLGVEFRAIVGSRNRENFWRRVRELGETNDPECITIDGDSIRDLAKAFILCKQGVEIKIQLEGKIIGTLYPESSIEKKVSMNEICQCIQPVNNYWGGEFCRCCGNSIFRELGIKYCHLQKPCQFCESTTCGQHSVDGNGNGPVRRFCEICSKRCNEIGNCPIHGLQEAK